MRRSMAFDLSSNWYKLRSIRSTYGTSSVPRHHTAKRDLGIDEVFTTSLPKAARVYGLASNGDNNLTLPGAGDCSLTGTHRGEYSVL